MRILFLSLSGLVFDVATPEREPLGGTESCFCYLARELASRGYDVTLVSRGGHDHDVMGVKHKGECNPSEYDVVISNAPIEFQGDNKPYYIFWNHLAHFDNSVRALLKPEVMNCIDTIVYVSEWQKNESEKQFGKAKNTHVIGNGLTPSFENMFKDVDDLYKAKIFNTAVYTSTPYRGLRLLPEIMEAKSDILLNVFSGLGVYQNPNDPYSGIYAECKKHHNIIIHGNVNQTTLAAELKKSQFMFYPSVFPETYCIAVLEAMAAGISVVTTNLAALPSTCGNRAVMAREENATLNDLFWRFMVAIEYARDHYDADVMFEQMKWVNNNFTWKHRGDKWVHLLENL